MDGNTAQLGETAFNGLPGDEGTVEAGGIENAFRHISPAQLDAYRELMQSNDDAAMGVISTALGLENAEKDTRQHLRLSISVRTLQFAIGRHFSNTKAGVTYNVAQTLLQSINQVIQNCLIPLAKAHPQPESPYFTAVDLKSVAEFFVDHVIQFFNLFSFVLRQDREQETAYVQNVVEIPYAPALEEGFSEDVWNEKLQKKAADEQLAREAAEAQASAEAQAAEEARLEKAKADALFKRKQELSIKPERLEEAVEKLIKWRIESEKQKLRDQYTLEVNALRNELQGLVAQEGKAGKAGKGK